VGPHSFHGSSGVLRLVRRETLADRRRKRKMRSVKPLLKPNLCALHVARELVLLDWMYGLDEIWTKCWAYLD